MYTSISKHITSIPSFRLAVGCMCGDLLCAGVRQIAADIRQAIYSGKNTVKCPKQLHGMQLHCYKHVRGALFRWVSQPEIAGSRKAVSNRAACNNIKKGSGAPTALMAVHQKPKLHLETQKLIQIDLLTVVDLTDCGAAVGWCLQQSGYRG